MLEKEEGSEEWLRGVETEILEAKEEFEHTHKLLAI